MSEDPAQRGLRLKPPTGSPNTQPMALRTSSLPSSTAAPAPALDWRVRVQQAVAGAAAAIAAGDHDRLATAFAELAEWDDRQRAYQARCGLVEAVLAYQPTSSDGWVGPFVTAAAALLDALEDEPREPVLLNYAGVLLYELLEAGAAEELFKAALRLDPSRAVRRREPPAGADPEAQPPAASRARSARACAACCGTRPEGRRPARGRCPGLTLSLCMIVKDEEEMLPGCLEPLCGRRRRDDRRRHRLDRPHGRDRGVVRREGRRTSRGTARSPTRATSRSTTRPATGSCTSTPTSTSMPEDAPRLRALLGRTWREGFYLVETNYTGGEDSGAAVTHLALRLLRQPARVPLRGPHPRAEDAHDADVPAGAVRDDHHPRSATTAT